MATPPDIRTRPVGQRSTVLIESLDDVPESSSNPDNGSLARGVVGDTPEVLRVDDVGAVLAS